MVTRIGINGFGRIGRLVLRAIAENGRDDVIPVAINDLGSVEANAQLFRYDSVHGRFPGKVDVAGDAITIRCVVGEGLAHVVGWYDKEWGFACRMLDTAALLGNL